jgi:hypothetical protein
MDIILDTNILRSDILLRGNEFNILLDYLKRTTSNVILPQIVIDEAKELFKKTLIERLKKFDSAHNNLRLIVPDFLENFNQNVEIEQEVDNYITFLKKSLEIKDNNIIPYNNNYLPELVQRTIKRIKPIKEDGKGFRDLLIWLSILDYVKTTYEKQIILISSNTNDFANGKNELHETLEEECKKHNVKINFFPNIKEFIKIHAIKTEYITISWINDNLDLNDVEYHFIEQVNYKTIIRSFEQTGYSSTGNIQILSAKAYDIQDLFIYEMIDESLIANVKIKMEAEIDVEYMKPYGEDYRIEGYDIANSYNCIEVDVYLSITIEKEKICEWQIDDFDFYGNWVINEGYDYY